MRDKVLEALQGGDYVSGQAIAERLGVSRAAVNKAIDQLRADGYDIEAAPNRGYRLLSRPDLLTYEEVVPYLATRVLGRRWQHVRETDSTNALARELAEAGAADGLVVVAETQRAGRGRLGRHWSSPPGGIWCSVLLRPNLSPSSAALLTLAAAVAAAEATEAVAGLRCGIKWPNDLLVNGRKVAGILTEMSAELDQLNYVVLGVGVNANFPTAQLPDGLLVRATTLMEERGQRVARAAWLGAFLNRCERWRLSLEAEARQQLISAWRDRSVTLGRAVIVTTPTGRLSGHAVDVDPDGALLVETADGARVRVAAGDVTLRE